MELRCVHCGAEVRRLLVQYSPGNIRLMKCESCKAVADPYVECEFMILLIDLILHKQKAYRTLLFNMFNENEVSKQGLLWKSALTYLILDGFRSLFLSGITEDWRSSSNSMFSIWICLRVLMAILLGNLMFFFTLLYTSRMLLRSHSNIIRHRGIILAVLFSSYFKIFILAMMVWEFPSSVLFIIDAFILSSNSVAMKVFTGLPTTCCIAVCFGAHVAKFFAYGLLLPISSSPPPQGQT